MSKSSKNKAFRHLREEINTYVANYCARNTSMEFREALLGAFLVHEVHGSQKTTQNNLLVFELAQSYFKQKKKETGKFGVQPTDKFRILSAVTSEFTHNNFNKFLEQHKFTESINDYEWRSANQWRIFHGVCAARETIEQRRPNSYTEQEIVFMIRCIYSKAYTHNIAFGTNHIALQTTKETVILPAVLRNHPHKTLFEMYVADCNRQASPIRHLKRGKFFEALNYATNGDDKALAALDSVSVKCGTRNFIGFRDFIERICIEQPLDLKQQLLDMVNNVESFLKSTFKSHLNNSEDEKCPSHSMRFVSKEE